MRQPWTICDFFSLLSKKHLTLHKISFCLICLIVKRIKKMKKILFILYLALAGVTAVSAQGLKFGVKAGFNASIISNWPPFSQASGLGGLPFD
jgi:hypothetical protein